MEKAIERKVSGTQVLHTLGLWVLLSALTCTVTFYGLHSLAPTWATTDNQSITIVAEVYFLFLVSAGIVFGGLKGIRYKLNFTFTSIKDIWFALKWYAIALGTSVLIYFLLSPIIGPLPNTLLKVLFRASDMSRLPFSDILAGFLIIIRACLLAPLTEELLFRGLLFGWLGSRYGSRITIFITSILFTSIHYFPILFPIGLLFGIATGWVRERTGSSFNFIIAHIVNSIFFLTIAYLIIIHI